MTFLSEGLGPARDNFSTNLDRLENLRHLTASMHNQQAAMHKERRAMVEEQWRTRSPLGYPVGGEELGWALAAEEERLSEEPRTTREMMLTYLTSILDVFFGQWQAEQGIMGPSQRDRWPPATPQNIAAVPAKMPAPPAGLTLNLQPTCEDRLVEIRARRNALVHCGGIADTDYCKATGNAGAMGQRLLVDDGYLDGAVEFVDDLVGAMAARVCSSPQSAAAAAARQPLIARTFV